jgi:hypothetical protein
VHKLTSMLSLRDWFLSVFGILSMSNQLLLSVLGPNIMTFCCCYHEHVDINWWSHNAIRILLLVVMVLNFGVQVDVFFLMCVCSGKLFWLLPSWMLLRALKVVVVDMHVLLPVPVSLGFFQFVRWGIVLVPLWFRMCPMRIDGRLDELLMECLWWIFSYQCSIFIVEHLI